MSDMETRTTVQDDVPQPIRGNEGATDPGPRDYDRDRLNPDMSIPPKTDAGTVPNLKFSFSDAHRRLEEGGWTREVTVRELPVATTLAGVNMRLTPGGVRELHWHKEAEWAYMIEGSARITSVDEHGRNFIDDLKAGDLWNFPSGIPHSIQGLEDGCEFLLVFDDGSFSENSTFSLTEWFAMTPKEVLAKNFNVPEGAFSEIPAAQLYMYQGLVPGSIDAEKVRAPAGTVPNSFSYRLHGQAPTDTSGGRVRIVDSSNFPAATTIAAGLVEIEPGAVRELHWHPTNDEWQYYIEGEGRMTVFASGGRARTFDFRAGDVGYVPFAMGHYIENTGSTPLRLLEMFRSDRFEDVSLNQWMALTPEKLVKEHLNVDDQVIRALKKEKDPVVG